MNTRLFLHSRANKTVGFLYNQDTNQANKLSFTSTVESDKGQYVLSAIEAMCEALENLDTDKFTNVCQVYMPSAVMEAIQSETYKFWLFTGVDSKGKEVSQATMDIWTRFANLWQAKGKYFVVRNIVTCYLSSEIKDNKVAYNRLNSFVKVNDHLANLCKSEIDKLVPRENTTEYSIPQIS